MTTTDTLSTNKTINAELEAKRQAVLASIKLKKSSQNNSRNQSPVPVITALNPPSVKAHHQEGKESSLDYLKCFHSNLRADLYDAILDLRSLGFSFEKIVEKSGVNRDFLAQCYTEWKFPVPKRVIEPVVLSEAKRQNIIVPTYNGPDFRAASTPPVAAYQRPMFNNKVYRVASGEKPEWLKDLVIDLGESSEEEDDDEQEDEESDVSESENSFVEDEECQERNKENEQSKSSDDEVVTIRIIDKNSVNEGNIGIVDKNIVNGGNINKKRKLSNDELKKVKKDKNDLGLEIRELSNEIKNKEELLQNKPPVKELHSRLRENASQLDWLRNQVERMEAEANELRTTICQEQAENDSFLRLKSRLADKLVEMDERDQEEKRLLEGEKRRLELKEKLMKQMKLKKQRKLEETQKQKVMSKQQINEGNNEVDRISSVNDKNNDLVSDETIHKIPKVINLF